MTSGLIGIQRECFPWTALKCPPVSAERTGFTQTPSRGYQVSLKVKPEQWGDKHRKQAKNFQTPLYIRYSESTLSSKLPHTSPGEATPKQMQWNLSVEQRGDWSVASYATRWDKVSSSVSGGHRIVKNLINSSHQRESWRQVKVFQNWLLSSGEASGAGKFF